MKLLCYKNDLINSLQIVSRAVPSKTTMPVLQCVMIDATTDRIRFITNDTEMGIDTGVKGTIEEKGYAAVEAKLLLDIIRKLPDGEVEISGNAGDTILLSAGKAKVRVAGRGNEEFTYLPEIERIDGFHISQKELKDIILKTIFSIGTGDSMMSGELMELKDNRLRVISLDGHRVSVRKYTFSENFTGKKVVVPGRTLQEISRIMTDDSEDIVDIYFTDKHIIFEFDSTVIVSRLIEGDFYNIDQMFSSDYETKISVNRKEFLDCLDRTTLFVKEGDKKPIIVSITDGEMELKIQSTIGSMDEKVSIEKQGKDLKLGFNPRFMIDALRAIDDDIVKLYFVNPKAPCFIKNDEGDYNYLVLPINIKVVD